MQDVDTLMQQAVSEKVFPGGVLLVSKEGTVAFHKAYGMADMVSCRRMRTDTLFDLASLTKPLATALAIMMLIKRKKLDLEQRLDAVLPAFVGDDKASIKVKHLLYHNSGLPDYRAYYKKVAHVPAQKRKNELRRLLVKEPRIYPIGEKVEYSDLGFMILEWMIEHLSAMRLDQFVSEKVYGPLGMENLFFIDLYAPRTKGLFAATEHCPWRNKLLVGEVHDENAYVSGGIQGHAGLFGSATAVHTLLMTLLATYNLETSNTFFSTDLVRLFFRRLPDTDKALGFDVPAVQNSSSGNFFSANSVGHLGFTGTSFWMDLDRSTIVVLLTNRVHPNRDNNAIKFFRPKLHDAIMKKLLGIN